eukprot:11048274-Alexandrium_andersonii.AAC.1
MGGPRSLRRATGLPLRTRTGSSKRQPSRTACPGWSAQWRAPPGHRFEGSPGVASPRPLNLRPEMRALPTTPTAPAP